MEEWCGARARTGSFEFANLSIEILHIGSHTSLARWWWRRLVVGPKCQGPAPLAGTEYDTDAVP